MSNHNHNHDHNHMHNHSSGNILVAFLLNFSFAIFEIIGGFFTGSTAILSDAVHDFGDSLALGLSLIFERIGRKKANNKYSYGFKRLSVIGAIVNIVVLTSGTIFVLIQAIEKLFNPTAVISQGMVFMAVVGITINGISVLRMKGSKNILDKTVMLHLLEDLLGWLAVFVVSIVIYFTNFYILDPILSLLICAIIGRNIYINTKSTFEIIMQAVPDTEIYDEVRGHLVELVDVKEIVTLNIWTLDGEEHIATMNLKVNDNSDKGNILTKVKTMLSHEGINTSTIELETIS